MNNDLKTKINELRQLGYGYKRIASELSVTASAARYACSKLDDEDFLINNCQNCGLPIKSIKGKKKRRFCSDKCRWQWWNKNQKDVNKKAYYIHQCKYCKKEFTVYGNSKRLYCSHECYIKHKTQKVNDQHE